MTQIASICNPISSSFLVLGYTKGKNEKYFLAKHESESDHEKLTELEDVINNWLNLAKVPEKQNLAEEEKSKGDTKR